MQHQITNPGKLLNANGSLREPGWGTDLLLEYNRADIQAAKWRIKEWDYYAVLNESYGLAFTVSDNGYLGLVSVTFFDFVNGTETSDTILTPLPMGKYKLPNTTAKGDVHFKNKRFAIDYLVKDGARQILCTVKNFKDGQDLSADITLQQPPMDTMVIATPWKESPKAFYYNQKMNCLRASGKATLGYAGVYLSAGNRFCHLRLGTRRVDLQKHMVLGFRQWNRKWENLWVQHWLWIWRYRCSHRKHAFLRW
jgi:hypothetical protein